MTRPELDEAVVGSGHRDADDHGEDDEQGDASETEFPHGCLLLLVAGGFYKRGASGGAEPDEDVGRVERFD